MKRGKLLYGIGLIGVLILLGGVLFYLSHSKAQFTSKSLQSLPPLTYTPKEIEFTNKDLKLNGSLYIPEGKGPFPGIVISHGSSKFGRKLTLYVAMSQKLAEKGYIVLSFDYRGFGESDDPPKFETTEDLDFVGDLSQAVSTLTTVKSLDLQHVYLIGHSFGAGVVIQEGIKDERVKKIVSISPGRRGFERFFGENAPEPDWPQHRISNDMKLTELISKELLYPVLISFLGEAILSFPQHPPFLFMDGSREDPKDLEYLKEIYTKMTEPKDYKTIRHADHYFGTRIDEMGFPEPPPYNKQIFRDFIDNLDVWLRGAVSFKS